MNNSSPIRVRLAQTGDAAAIARVRVDSWRTTYRGLLPDEYLVQLSYEQSTQSWRSLLEAPERRGLAFVAETITYQIVGFAIGGANRDGDPVYDGELYAIYLLEEHQHQGLGKRLLTTLTRRLLQEGISSMVAWMLSGNPAGAFYRAMGGEQVNERGIMIGGRSYREIAFGWLDIHPLAYPQAEEGQQKD